MDGYSLAVRSFYLTIGLCFLSCLLLAESPPNPAEPWIRQLDHTSWHKRVEATHKLSEMGLSARDSLLDLATRQRDTEGGRRARVLLGQIPGCLTNWSRLREQYESHVRRLPEKREADDLLKRIARRFDPALPAALRRHEAASQDYEDAVRGAPGDWDTIQKKMETERRAACTLVQKAIQEAGGRILDVPREIPRNDAGVRARGYIDVFDWRIEYERKVYRLSLDERGRLLLWPEVFDQERLHFQVRNPYLSDTRVGTFDVEGKTLPVVFAVRYDPGTEDLELLLHTGRAQVQSPTFGFYSVVEEHWAPFIPKEEREMFLRAGRCEGTF